MFSLYNCNVFFTCSSNGDEVINNVNFFQDEQGVVTCLDEQRHGYESGDFVTFSEVQVIISQKLLIFTCNKRQLLNYNFIQTLTSRVVTKISSCRVNTTSRRRIKWLGISFGSIFLLFSNKSRRGPLSQQPGEIPGPRLLMTTLDKKKVFRWSLPDTIIPFQFLISKITHAKPVQQLHFNYDVN